MHNIEDGGLHVQHSFTMGAVSVLLLLPPWHSV
jgi:hypothetical protein